MTVYTMYMTVYTMYIHDCVYNVHDCVYNVHDCIYMYIYMLQKNDEQFKSTRLVKMALGVAKGMNYLSEVGYVHRVRLWPLDSGSNMC